MCLGMPPFYKTLARIWYDMARDAFRACARGVYWPRLAARRGWRMGSCRGWRMGSCRGWRLGGRVASVEPKERPGPTADDGARGGVMEGGVGARVLGGGRELLGR